MFEASIVRVGQRRWFWVMAWSAVFLTSNGFYLYFYESGAISASMFYMANVLVHLALGVLFAAPFIVFSVSHWLTSKSSRNAKSKWVGYILFGVIFIALVTGLYLLWVGVKTDEKWILWAHIITSVLAVATFTVHRLVSTRVQKLLLMSTWESAIVLGSFFLLVVIHNIYEKGFKADEALAATATPVSFAPSPARTSNGQFFPPEKMGDVEGCKECHADAYKQWQASVHAHSSLMDDPFHRRTFEYMVRNAPSPILLKFCAGCHDPVLLLGGQLQNLQGNVDLSKIPFNTVSITCNTCHLIDSIDIRGDGAYVMAQVFDYPWQHSDSKILKWFNWLLIREKPEPHRMVYSRPFHKTAEACATCHKVEVPKGVNGYKWMRAQDQFDSWDASGMSGNSAQSYYSANPKFGKCADCHLPWTPSADAGAVQGKIHDHSMVAANIALPLLLGDSAWVKKTTAFLKDNRVSVDILGYHHDLNGTDDFVAPLDAPSAGVQAGESVRLDVVVRSKRVGHRFPDGTMDINEVWVDLAGYDENGHLFFRNGAVNPDLTVDSTAHFIRARIFTADSNLIARHNLNEWAGVLYNRTIGPGSADVIHYRVNIPKEFEGKKVKFVATVNYRKFNRFYTEWALNHSDAPAIPIVDMATHEVSLPVGPQKVDGSKLATQAKDRDRFNDYGIGLFMYQEDNRGANQAWNKVVQIDPNYADGYINLVRTTFKEGNLDGMKQNIDKAEAARPGFYKAHYWRGIYYKQIGKLDEALKELLTVNKEFPRDRTTLLEIGRVHYLLGKYDEAIGWYQSMLAIDPEDANAHYNLMLCYRATGRKGEADQLQPNYEQFKVDEYSQGFASKYRVDHPADNNEAQEIHEHHNTIATPMIAEASPKKGVAKFMPASFRK